MTDLRPYLSQISELEEKVKELTEVNATLVAKNKKLYRRYLGQKNYINKLEGELMAARIHHANSIRDSARRAAERLFVMSGIGD